MLGYALFGILLGNDKITQPAITCLILPHFAKLAAKTHISQIPEIHCKTGNFRANQGEINNGKIFSSATAELHDYSQSSE